jgi:hypothetical protein
MENIVLHEKKIIFTRKKRNSSFLNPYRIKYVVHTNSLIKDVPNI